MRITVICCDNCREEIARGVRPDERKVTAVLGREWCSNCADLSASRNLIGVPFDEWPLLVRRYDLRRWLEWRDRKSPNIERELRSLRDRLAHRDRELREMRETAAEGYASGDMARTLSDLASAARRRERVA